MTRRSNGSIVAMVVALLLCTAADLGSKAWAEQALSIARIHGAAPVCQVDEQGYRQMQRLRRGSVVLIDGWMELRYAENCGAAFSMLANAPSWLRAGVFYASAIGFVGMLLWWYVRGQGGVLFVWSVPLLASGAIGNLVDRVRLGYVVDFIRVFHVFESGPWEYPTFNIADVTIFIGAALLILDNMRKPAPSTTVEPTTDVASG